MSRHDYLSWLMRRAADVGWLLATDDMPTIGSRLYWRYRFNDAFSIGLYLLYESPASSQATRAAAVTIDAPPLASRSHAAMPGEDKTSLMRPTPPRTGPPG